MVTPPRRIASPSFAGGGGGSAPAANGAPRAHGWPHVPGRARGWLQNRTGRENALVWAHAAREPVAPRTPPVA